MEWGKFVMNWLVQRKGLSGKSRQKDYLVNPDRGIILRVQAEGLSSE